MPKGAVNESKWNEAKASVKKQYKFSEENPRFWKLVNSVYQKMGGKFSKKSEKSLADLITACEQLEKSTPSYIQDKRLYLKIEREDVLDSGLTKGEKIANTLQIINYLSAGGRFTFAKSEESLVPESILKSNIAQQFGIVKSLPEVFADMFKSLPGEIKYPHRYMTRVKDENTGRWRYLYKKAKDKKAQVESDKKVVKKEDSVPTKEAEKPTGRPETKKVKSSTQLKQRAKMKTSAVATAKHEPHKVQKSEDDILAERIEKGDLKLNQQEPFMPESRVIEKASPEAHIKEETAGSKEYEKMSEKEKDPKEKQALKKMSQDEAKHAEHFEKKAEEKKTEKSMSAVDEQWVESRMKGVERDLKSQYSDMGDAEATTQAKEILENMFKAGLR